MLNTSPALFVKGEWFRFVLPKDMPSLPCLPTNDAITQVFEIPRGALVECQGIIPLALGEKLVTFLVKNSEDEDGTQVFVGLTTAQQYCLHIHRHDPYNRK